MNKETKETKGTKEVRETDGPGSPPVSPGIPRGFVEYVRESIAGFYSKESGAVLQGVFLRRTPRPTAENEDGAYCTIRVTEQTTAQVARVRPNGGGKEVGPDGKVIYDMILCPFGSIVAIDESASLRGFFAQAVKATDEGAAVEVYIRATHKERHPSKKGMTLWRFELGSRPAPRQVLAMLDRMVADGPGEDDIPF